MPLTEKNVTTLTELQTVSGSGNRAIVLYDVSSGEPIGLDVQVLINLDASVAGLVTADTSLNALTEKLVNKSTDYEGDKTSTTKYYSAKTVYDGVKAFRDTQVTLENGLYYINI